MFPWPILYIYFHQQPSGGRMSIVADSLTSPLYTVSLVSLLYSQHVGFRFVLQVVEELIVLGDGAETKSLNCGGKAACLIPKHHDFDGIEVEWESCHILLWISGQI